MNAIAIVETEPDKRVALISIRDRLQYSWYYHTKYLAYLHTVNLHAGQQQIAVYVPSSGYNINWIKFARL